MSNDTILVAEEGDIDLNLIVNEEAEQYEKATRVQGVIDNINESNSGLVKGHDEQTGEENEKENSGNNKKRSHTQLDSRKQVIAFQDRVITININYKHKHCIWVNRWKKDLITASYVLEGENSYGKE